MTAFFAIAHDVPRRLARGWIAWILIALSLVVIAIFAGGVGRGVDQDGTPFLTFFGNDTRPPPNSGLPVSAMEASLAEYLGNLFGQFFACYVGVFAGLVFLADAVTSAFAPGSAELNVPKPLHRATILFARHVGAVLSAGFFATVLIGGALLVAWIRTGIFVPKVLVYIPGSVVLFALLHGLGTIAGVAVRNAFFSAFFSVTVWLASAVTKLPEWIGWEHSVVPVFVRVAEIAKVAHRILPRANDLPSFITRILEHKPLDPLWERGDIELSANVLVWWGLALAFAVLLVDRRDF